MDLPTMVMQLAKRLYDAERRIHNLVRPARVTEVDTKKGLVKVAFGLDDKGKEVVSGWIPWASTRAGEINKWEPPSKDEQVLMINMGGEIGPMSVIHGALYSQKYQQPHDKGAEKRTTIRKNNEKDEPDDKLPSYIEQKSSTNDLLSMRDKHKNPDKSFDVATTATEQNSKATSGGVTNQFTRTANADISDNPGGTNTTNAAKVAYKKKPGASNSDGSTSFQTAGFMDGDGFDGFSDGATS